MAQDAASLDHAKERLRTALTRLENVVEQRVAEVKNISPEGKNADIKQLIKENKQLKELNSRAAKRIDTLIYDLEHVVGK